MSSIKLFLFVKVSLLTKKENIFSVTVTSFFLILHLYLFNYQLVRLVSGSDDFTLFLWTPTEDKKPLCRMTGTALHTVLYCAVL